jgi:two-component system, NtrC family, sensor histidine kinase PilS
MIDLVESRSQRRQTFELLRIVFYSLVVLAVLWQGVLQKDFINYRGEVSLFLSLGLLLGLRLFALKAFRNRPAVLDQIAIAAVWVFFSRQPATYLLLSVANTLLTAFEFGGAAAVRAGAWGAVLGLFGNGYLLALGVDVPTTTPFVFVGGLLVTGYIGSALSRDLVQAEDDLSRVSSDLFQQKNLNEVLVENMWPGVLALDAAGQVASANRGASRIFETLGLVGRHCSELDQALWQKTRACQVATTFDLETRGLQGQRMILEVVASPIRLNPHTLSGWVLLIQNQTETRNLEQALRQKEKLAAVGQLAAGMAHEIRNPLASISGSVQLLAATLPTATDEDKKLLAIVIREIDRLNDLISEFMEYVRPDTEDWTEFVVKDCVGEALDIVARNPRLPGPIAVSRRFEYQGPITGNFNKIKQAILNILVNSYQAMAKSSEKSLVVSVALLPGNGGGTGSGGSLIEIRIKDTGSGIAKDNLRKIFEPFHTTKPKGTGLGLAITHKIVEAHEGSITVDSEYGVGTEFILRLPRGPGQDMV